MTRPSMPPPDPVAAALGRGRRVLAIIPAYNEAASLPTVLNDLREHVPYADLLVVNDGSKDATSTVAKANGAWVIELPINLGIGGAVQTGLTFAHRADYDVAFQFDGDGQHLAVEVHRIVNPVLDGQRDVVIGSRFLGVKSYRVPWNRRIGISTLNRVCSALSGTSVTDATSGFRAYNRAAIAVLAREYPQDYPEPEAIITMRKHRLRVGEVPVQMRERVAGRSSITPIRSTYYMAKVLLALLIHSFGTAGDLS
jgi:glycosyltransferase involved in cell wall biosynthesis